MQNESNAEEVKEEDTSQVQVSDSNQENTDNKNENDVKIMILGFD